MKRLAIEDTDLTTARKLAEAANAITGKPVTVKSSHGGKMDLCLGYVNPEVMDEVYRTLQRKFPNDFNWKRPFQLSEDVTGASVETLFTVR